MLLQSLPETFTDPRAYLLLVAAVVGLLYWQRTLSWPEYKRFHGFKRRVLPVVDRYTTLFVVSQKGGRGDPEFLTGRSAGVRETFERLVDTGGSPHLVNSLKTRPASGGQQYSAAHVVWTHDDGTQTEAYLFDAGGRTDVYAHHEPGVSTPNDHLEGWQTDGDARGVVREALGMEADADA